MSGDDERDLAMPIYDVHAHCVPPGLIPALRHDGTEVGVEVTSDGGRHTIHVGDHRPATVRPDLIDLDQRLAAMDRAGVDVQLVSPWIGLTGYTLPPRQGTRWARLCNDALAEMVAARPRRLVGLAQVPLQAPEAAADELRYAVRDLGMAGAEIATTVAGTELDDDGLEPFWSAAAELRCIVLIHPDQVLPGRSVPRHFLNNTVGNASETTIAVAHLLCAGVLERHPTLRICVVHGGGYLPYQAGRLDRGQVARPDEAGGHLPERLSTYLRRLYFDTITHSATALRFLIDFAGPERVVLGSDYPFEMGDRDPVHTLGTVPFLSAEERRLILRDNVQRLLDDVRRAPASH